MSAKTQTNANAETIARQTANGQNKPQPIPHVPVLKSLRQIPRIVKNPLNVFSGNFETYGHIYKTRMPRASIIATDKPEFIQHVLQKNHKNYHKSDAQSVVLASQIGYGLLTVNGDYWLQQRRLIQPGFHRQKLAELVNAMLVETNDFADLLERDHNNGKAFDISKSMMKLTFKVVAKALFSTAVDELQLNRIDYVISTLQHYVIRMIRRPWSLPPLYLDGTIKYYESLREEIDAILFGVLRERRATGKSYDDLLDMLINSKYEDTGLGMTDQQLRDESIILFLAGHETSANALSWTLYLLSQHPEVEQKLLNELNEVLGERDATFADLPKLEYTLQVINESMRLYPPAWIVDRIALNDDYLGDHHVPKGSVLILYIYGVHRNPEYWETPLAFKPERFAKEAMKERHRYAYMPFGGGPRQCIGSNFALMEMQVVLAQLLRRFKFNCLPNQKIDPEPLVTLRPRNGIQMTLEKRQ